MTVLADTSAWIEYLRRTGSRINHEVREALTRGELATTDPVALEVLAGARDNVRAEQIQRLLDGCVQLPQEPWTDAEVAASVYRACRKAGETPRSLIDCTIAAVAIRSEVPVLHQDRDYDLLARHTELRLAR
ncbi:MAG: type II toxin-antitoxin system VapC family toxin [Streptosporangiales bacterium]